MSDEADPKETGNAFTRSRKEKAPHHVWKPAFLEAYAITGIIGLACEAADITRAGVRDARESDPVFAQDYLDAEQRAIDRMEEEARRRAFDGTEEEVFNKQGDSVGTRKKYSDDLAKFLLSSRRYPRSLVIEGGESVKDIGQQIARVAHSLKDTVPSEAKPTAEAAKP